MISRILGLGGAAIVLAALLLWDYGVANPNVTRWLLLQLIASGFLLTGVIQLARGKRWGLDAFDLVVLVFILYAVSSLLWSADWWEGLPRAVNLVSAGTIVLGVRRLDAGLLEQWVPPIGVAAILGCAALAWYLPPEFYSGFGNPNWRTEYVILLLPFCVAGWLGIGEKALWRIPAGLIAVIGSVWFLAFRSGSEEVWLAAGAGLVYLAVESWRVHERFIAALVLLVPVNVAFWSGWFGPSTHVARALGNRLELGYNTLAMWWDSPIVGWGIGSFNYEYARYQERHLEVFPWLDTLLRPVNVFPGEAHNEFLQVLSEYGLIGFALLIFGAFLIWRKGRWSRSRLQNCACVSLILSCVLSLVAFPWQLPSTALLTAMALGIAAQGNGAIVSLRSGWLPAAFSIPVAAGTIAFSLYVEAMNVIAQAYFAITRVYIAKDPLGALRANLYAVELWPYDQQIRHQLTMSLGNALIDGKGKVLVEPEAADAINDYVKTAAPYTPAMILSRLDYLTSAGRENEKRDEIESGLAYLKTHARIQPMTWLMEAKWAAMNTDIPRLINAITQGRKFCKDTEKGLLKEFDMFAELTQPQ